MAIQPIKFLVSPSATASNGSKTITVTGNVDCSHVYSGTAIALGTRQVVEAVSGTKPDVSGNSVITLRDDWTDPTTTAKLVAFNTIEGLAEAIRRAREVVQASEAALSGNISYMGDHSAATGNFPAAPGEGLGSQIYRISIAGTISEREYKVGELIYYDQYFSQWRSFFDGFGTAAQRNAGTGTADLPDNAQLNLRLGTSGNLGNAAQRNVMASLTDVTTPLALMPRGAFGYGSSLFDGESNALPALTSLRSVNPGAANSPNAAKAWAGFSVEVGSGAGQGATLLIAQDAAAVDIRVTAAAGAAFHPWVRLFHNYNIVGTVSQSGGITTGAIIEFGEGLYGSYVRFAGGLQICFYNGQYIAPNANNWPFPAVFSSPPAVLGLNRGGANNSVLVSASSSGNSSVNFSAIVSTTASAINADVYLFAIGKWQN